jgi:hypothetical protein
MKDSRRFARWMSLELFAIAVGARAAPPPSQPSITGTLVVSPSGPVDPGVTVLNFDANITSMTAGSAWLLSLWVHTPPETAGLGLGNSATAVQAAPAHYAGLFKPYPVPCWVARTNQVCIQLKAQAVHGSAAMSVGPPVCLPIKIIPGPKQAALIVHSPPKLDPGAVLTFAAKIPRQDCDSEFRVVQSPSDDPSAWATTWRAGTPAPELVFPETFRIAGSVATAGGYSRSAGVPPCFVLEMRTPFSGGGPPIDKWCWESSARPGAGQPQAALHPAEPPGPSRDSLALRPASRNDGARREAPVGHTGNLPGPGPPAQAALPPPKPDLVIVFHQGGKGWGDFTSLLVKNQGNASAGPSHVRLSKAGIAPTLISVDALCAGCYVQIYPANFKPYQNELPLYSNGGTLTCDALNEVEESNESNNSYTWDWTAN